MTLKIAEREVEIIDIHLHPPRVPSKTPEEVIDQLADTLSRAGVDMAVLLAIDTNVEDLVYLKELKVEEARKYFWYFWREIPVKSPYAEAYLRDLGKQILEVVKTSEEEVKLFMDRYPAKFLGFGSVNPNVEEGYVFEKLMKIKKSGFKGIKLLPTLQFFNPSDRKLDFIYEFAERNDLAILMHMGCNFGPFELPSLAAYARPKHLRRIAEEFPDLKLILAHLGGYTPYLPGKYLDEAIELMSASDNIYLDTSAVFIEDLIQKAIARLGAERILFGSDYPAITNFCDRHTGLRNYVRWLAALDISLEAKEKIFGKNARKLLGIPNNKIIK
ncbi:MAG: amidohydrolase family protein [Methanocellales archaeon]